MEGMPLIARVNKKSIGIVNNEVFDVEKIDKDSITVRFVEFFDVPFVKLFEVFVDNFNRLFKECNMML
jgi:hypothetical protein